MSDIKKSMTAVDKSIKSLNKATEDLLKARATDAKVREDFAATIADQLIDIEFNDGQLADIKSNHSIKLREAVAELNLKVLENSDEVLSDLMEDRHLADINQDDLAELKASLEKALAGNSEAISIAVDAARSNDAMTYRMKENSATAEHKVAVAKLEADNHALTNQVTHLESTIITLNMTIDSERAARVQIAASESNAQGVVVNTSAK